MMYDRDKGLLVGLKFNDAEGMAVGKIDSALYRGKRDFPTKRFVLSSD